MRTAQQRAGPGARLPAEPAPPALPDTPPGCGTPCCQPRLHLAARERCATPAPLASLCFVLIYLNSKLTQIFCLDHFGRNFTIVVAGVHKRILNGILGLLCKLHYPRCTEIDDQLQRASAWEHYREAVDQADRQGRCYGTKAERVLQELWVSLSGTTFVNTSH